MSSLRCIAELCIVAGLVLIATPARALDTDGDGVADASDNCVDVANLQLDTDQDGYGNRCDADLNNDGVVGVPDWLLFQTLYSDAAPEVDFNEDGVVGVPDFLHFLSAYAARTLGPSGLSCAGSGAPCLLPPPRPELPVVQVGDAAPPHGRLDQRDIDAAFAACGDGCNLQLLAATYEDVAIDIGGSPGALAIYGFGPQASILRSPIFPPGADYDALIEVLPDAPDGGVLQDFALDGRKTEQQPPTTAGAFDDDKLSKFAGIRTLASVYSSRADWLVQRLEVSGFTEAGISVADAPRWIVRQNVIHDIGCHQWDTPCGSPQEPGNLSNPWNALPDALIGDPDVTVVGYKVSGQGVNVQRGSSGTQVLANEIFRTTKHGIEVYTGNCGDPLTSADVIVADNDVHDAGVGGIVLNGGCAVQVLRNHVRRTGVTNGGTRNVGNGFRCGANAENSAWIDNVSRDNDRSGYNLSCFGASNLLFRGNASRNNCQGPSLAAELFFDGLAPPDPRPVGLVIEDFVATGNGCYWGVRIRNRDGVTIRDTDVEGGSQVGIEIVASANVEVVDSSFGGDGLGTIDGVVFKYKDGAPPMADVYVQPSTLLIGCDNAVAITGTVNEAFGDDPASVVVCSEETVPPGGCDP